MPALDRFMMRVDKDGPGGCWLWMGGDSGNGYGRFALTRTHVVTAHRWIFEQAKGAPIEEGMTLDHLCRTTRCVNPDHLEEVTHRVNVLRGDTVSGRNARKTHCKRGHPFDEANTYINSRGHRVCRECTREAGRRYQRRRASTK